MHALLTELLELSRIGRMMNEPENIPFDGLIKDALELLAAQADLRVVRQGKAFLITRSSVLLDLAPDNH